MLQQNKQQELQITDTERRIMVCRAFIEMLSTVEDPRQQEALEHYGKQLKHLEETLKCERNGTPPPIVIGLKTATLFAKSDPAGEN